MGTLQALLTEMSGLKKPRGFFNRVVRRSLGMQPKPPPKYRILMMMATNMPEALDEALLRPGPHRPHLQGRLPVARTAACRTYEGYLAKVQHELTPEQIDKLATITPYATGATIKDLVNEALIVAIRDGRDIDHLARRDQGQAAQGARAARGRRVHRARAARRRDPRGLPRGRRVPDAAATSTSTSPPSRRAATTSAWSSSIPPEDQFTQWRTEYEADIMVSLASLAGERMFFDGDNSSGVSGDLHNGDHAIATLMEGFWGMGDGVSSLPARDLGFRWACRGAPRGGRPGRAPEGRPGRRKARSPTDRGNLGACCTGRGVLRENEARCSRSPMRSRSTRRSAARTCRRPRGPAGPAVDGRPYADPTVHRGAARLPRGGGAAHRGHAPLSTPIPATGGAIEGELVGDEVVVGRRRQLGGARRAASTRPAASWPGSGRGVSGGVSDPGASTRRPGEASSSRRGDGCAGDMNEPVGVRLAGAGRRPAGGRRTGGRQPCRWARSTAPRTAQADQATVPPAAPPPTVKPS